MSKLLGKKKTAIIASGETFADALSIGTYASENGYPILLVKKNLIPLKISKSLKDLDIKNVYVIGGNSTIDEKVTKQLPKIKERIFGTNRYETSVMIAKSKFSESTHAFISSGNLFSDSLVIGAIGGKHHIPVLLTKQNEAKKTADYIKNSMINEFTVIGGKTAVNDEIIMKILK
ncbi:cell wall-binding repeat-containing protein [Peptostreptococcus canis]|uniref:cell wall-binding repeat-containing protein n=1 Tax=Peptostreptococcus canis TaxID=1159213 RepID=UPI002ED5060B